MPHKSRNATVRLRHAVCESAHGIRCTDAPRCGPTARPMGCFPCLFARKRLGATIIARSCASGTPRAMFTFETFVRALPSRALHKGDSHEDAQDSFSDGLFDTRSGSA